MMVQDVNQPDPQGPVLLSLGRRDTSRLLEVYVKRSLSLNDKSLPRRSINAKASKLKTRGRTLKHGTKRSSSDAFAYSARVRPGNLEPVPATSPTEYPTESFPPRSSSPEKGQRKTVGKEKNASGLKSFFSLFSRKGREEKGDREPNHERTGACGTSKGSVQAIPFHLTPEHLGKGEQDSLQSQNSLGKRRSLLRLSLHSHARESAQTQRQPSFRILPVTGQAEAVVCVEPGNAYYEKVTEELERIVKEVKDSPVDESQPAFEAAIQSCADVVTAEDEVTIEKIIGLLKQQGDDINVQMKESTCVSSFFQSLSYKAFQQLADRYMEEEVPRKLPEDTAAPELVKFAFTLDFTAKVAGLANQAVSRIMGFGNQYLQDRFTQMSKVQVPVSQSEAGQSFMGPD